MWLLWEKLHLIQTITFISIYTTINGSDLFWKLHIFGQYGIFTEVLESLIKKKKTLLTKWIHFPLWCSGQKLSLCMTLWLFWGKFCMWEIILGSSVQRPLEQFICVTAGWCCVAFCALLGHRCGGEGNRCSHWSQSAHLSERIITSCFAFCLYGTWLLRISVSGLATGARLWRTRSEVTAAVASAGTFDSVGPLFNPPHPHPHSPFKGKYVLQKETC